MTDDFGIDKPIWLNESGVSVGDDYPGPVCEPDSLYRATMSEQADFIIQSAFYAIFGRANMLFSPNCMMTALISLVIMSGTQLIVVLMK